MATVMALITSSISFAGDRLRLVHRLHVPRHMPGAHGLFPAPPDALLEQKALQQGPLRDRR